MYSPACHSARREQRTLVANGIRFLLAQRVTCCTFSENCIRQVCVLMQSRKRQWISARRKVSAESLPQAAANHQRASGGGLALSTHCTQPRLTTQIHVRWYQKWFGFGSVSVAPVQYRTTVGEKSHPRRVMRWLRGGLPAACRGGDSKVVRCARVRFAQHKGPGRPMTSLRCGASRPIGASRRSSR